MARRPCCAKEEFNRGAWTVMEDKILTNYIKVHGEGKWRDLPLKAGLKRCRKSCRLRWLNYLRPNIKRGNISNEEEDLIVRLHKLLGNRWSLIAGKLPGRTDNEIKNYWNTIISKKVLWDDKVPVSTKKKNKLGKLKLEVGDNNYRPHQVIRPKAVKCTRAVNFLSRRQSRDADKIISISNSDSFEVYVNSNGGSPSEDDDDDDNNNNNNNNNNNGGGSDDSWGLSGEDNNLLMDFDISDLLPDNYEMVINNWEEKGDVFTSDADNVTASSQPFGDFDFDCLEKFLGSEEWAW